MKTLLIDNYDSFTYNLYHYLQSSKCKVDVIRNEGERFTQAIIKPLEDVDKVSEVIISADER